MVTYLFIFFSVLAIAAALAMVLNKNTVNSALFLVINMVSIAGIYLLLEAQFLAVIQIIVYAGAIMVLFLFVIMLLNLEKERSLFDQFRVKYFVAFFLAVIVLSQLLYALGSWTETLPTVSENMAQIGTVEAIGDVLYTDYLLPFEITAILLTAAVVGALVVAQQKIVTNND
jgi:NADH-quinone oxidoreductase subunit J